MINPNFINSYAKLPERFYTKSLPTKVKDPRVITINKKLAQELGLSIEWLESDDGIGMLSGNSMPSGSDPLAQAYAGHQFGGWSPLLGDGRAHLIGQINDSFRINWDIQLKGSGPTPYSRRGDGRAWLGPVLREYLVSESMHHLGVPTTRSLAAISTGEIIFRDGPRPAAIITRVAQSHIRVGTFEYFSSRGDLDAVSELMNYVIKVHYPELKAGDALGFLDSLISRQAMLISKWLSVGFIHGVMNTDNTHVGGLTIDYGPCAFMDEYDPKKVFSSIDTTGRYAYNQQQKIIVWNLARLALSILPLIDPIETEAIKKAEVTLGNFDKIFMKNWLKIFLKKIGIKNEKKGDAALIHDLLMEMNVSKADFTKTFRDLSKPNQEIQKISLSRNMSNWISNWKNRILDESNPMNTMSEINPVYVPRNHLIELAIQESLKNDFRLFNRLLSAAQNPFKEVSENQDLYLPPTDKQVVKKTYCGT